MKHENESSVQFPGFKHFGPAKTPESYSVCDSKSSMFTLIAIMSIKLYDLLFLKKINHLTLEMTLNCPKISAAGFFDVGYNLIPMVFLTVIAV